MFALPFRLDLNVIVGPVKPRHIKTTLSGHLPILIDYMLLYGPMSANCSAIWRMRAALKHRHRVREISFGDVQCGPIFRKFIKATDNHFPALESLVLGIPDGHETDIPATFLRGQDRSDLPLRRLGLYGGSPAFASRFLLSTTALTDLTLSLSVTSDAALLDLSRGSSLLACLQRMQCLRSLNLTTPHESQDFLLESQHSPVPKDTTATVSMSKLTRFHYSGLTTFLNHLMSGLSAPSLQDARFELCNEFPLLYFSWVIDNVREEFRSVSVAFNIDHFLLLSSTHLGEIDHFEPSSFKLDVNFSESPNSMNSMRSTPSTRLAMAEELTLNLRNSGVTRWEPEDASSMREFLCQFRSVRLLRVNPFVQEIGLYLKQDEDGQEAIFPVLEQVEISIWRWSYWSDEEYQLSAADALAAFGPCERAGRLVKVYHCEQTKMQFMNAL
jgi:hypothetical protein